MNRGKNYLDKGIADQAITAFAKATTLNPTQSDAHLNLANAYLAAGQNELALKEALQVLNLDPISPAAHYVAGCADIHLARFEEAIKQLQPARDYDPSVIAVSLQLGLARLQLKQWEEAIGEFQSVISIETNHPSAHYQLSQALVQAGHADEATRELDLHKQISAKLPPGPPPSAATYEKCAYTQASLPFKLDQPEKDGIRVVFSDQTDAVFGTRAKSYQGPVAILDINHRGQNDLFALESGKGFRVLWNANGTFQTLGEPAPAIEGAHYTRYLVGDLQNDRFEDVIALSDKGTQVFKFATNGGVTDMSAFSRLAPVAALDGALVDLDFTGRLDLIAITKSNEVRVFRNLGNFFFRDITATSGVPASLTMARNLVADDWNNDDLMDLFVAREGQAPLILTKIRGGALSPTNGPASWPAASIVATADLDNDLRTDVVLASAGKLEIFLSGQKQPQTLNIGPEHINRIEFIDYDNDGWLDICTIGDHARIWRNRGLAGFEERTAALNLDKLVHGRVESIACADFDSDCDTDLILSLEGGGLQFLRNDGGNANHQLKVRLFGNRSNASGIGIRVEGSASGLRNIRTVRSLPLEIGVGKHDRLDSLTVHWFDLPGNSVDVAVDCKNPYVTAELILPTGSCPYLYAWDGKRYRFVTDILGAAPVGLPVAENVYIEAEPEEYVWIGNENSFRPRQGEYSLQITEELREVLYLDEAKLVVADHPAGTEIHPTNKLLPRGPFPPADLMLIHNRHPLREARDSVNQIVTSTLAENDGKVLSPPQLRVPQLRGLAEAHEITLDFGPLDSSRPLVLALTGWLRFGGGTANIAASFDPTLPFPFPALEAEAENGSWSTVPVIVGAPAGKTKTILVELQGKLPAGTRRLRLKNAFEIYWDRIALFEKAPTNLATILDVRPNRTDLHWRGYSDFENLPASSPLTPIYEKVNQAALWTITPMGWCTRYGEVNELLNHRDDALVLLNGGDELTIGFSAATVPTPAAGSTRDFFLYVDGWDKDADVHVKLGSQVGPLPFHGMNDQQYGEEADSRKQEWTAKYNTRWVGQFTFERKKR